MSKPHPTSAYQINDMMRRIISLRAFAILFGLAVLGACAAQPTEYGKVGTPGWGNPFGYHDKNIGEDEYSIVAIGNPSTGKERVLDIALLRAASIAKEQNRTHFVITNQVEESLPGHEAVTVIVPIGGELVWLPVGETEEKQPRAILLIRLPRAGETLDARALAASDVIAEIGKRLPGAPNYVKAPEK